jgi:DNA-binding transcriptional MerR regulator
MRIGELARRAGTSPRALRHYEQEGLLAARRRANGYREFDEHDLRLVAEIRSLLAIGFTLAETRPFVECLRAGNDRGVTCPDAAAVYRRKIAEIDACTARLGEIRAGLVGQLADELAARSPAGRRARSQPGIAPADVRAVPVPDAAPACALSIGKNNSSA